MEKMLNFYKNILKNGSQILVEGRIQTGSYEKQDGTKVYTTDLVVEHVYFCGSKQQNNTTENFEEFAQNNNLDVNVVEDNSNDLPF